MILYDIIWYYMILYDIIWYYMILYDSIILYDIMRYYMILYVLYMSLLHVSAPLHSALASSRMDQAKRIIPCKWKWSCWWRFLSNPWETYVNVPFTPFLGLGNMKEPAAILQKNRAQFTLHMETVLYSEQLPPRKLFAWKSKVALHHWSSP